VNFTASEKRTVPCLHPEMNGFEIFTYTLGSFLKKEQRGCWATETSETEIDFVKGNICEKVRLLESFVDRVGFLVL